MIVPCIIIELAASGVIGVMGSSGNDAWQWPKTWPCRMTAGWRHSHHWTDTAEEHHWSGGPHESHSPQEHLPECTGVSSVPIQIQLWQRGARAIPDSRCRMWQQ